MDRLLRRTTIRFKEDYGLSYNSSSLMQGVLMDNVTKEFGDRMHISGIRPYSQYLYRKDNSLEWTINTLDEEVDMELTSKLLDTRCNDIHIKNKNITLSIADKKREELSYDDLLRDTFFSTCSRYISIRFKTPTSFKTDGKYQFYPTVEHIMKSLTSKYNSCGFDSNIVFDEDMRNISEYMNITGYSLKSTLFHLEGVKIPAFTGSIKLKINGPQQLVNMVNLLFRFGEYSGVGIKTAIGMGAVEIVK